MLNEPALHEEHETVTAACRRIGTALGFDAVGVLHRGTRERRHLTWWASPAGSTRPLDVADVIEGKAAGWVVVRHGEGAVFARLTERTSTRAMAVLEAVARSLVDADGGVLGRPLELPEPRLLAPVPDPLRPATGAGGDAADAAPAPVPASFAATLDALLQRDRARLAYEIHDGLTQSVTAAVLTLETLRGSIERDPREAVAALAETNSEIRACLGRLRSTLDSLSGGEAAAPTPDESLADYVEDAARRWHLPVRLSVEGALPVLPAATAEAAHVVLSEGLANAAKHAGAHEVEITIAGSPGAIRLEVEDRGSGFSIDDVRGDGHYGLAMMRARIAEVGGELDVRSTPGRGTRVVARLPVPNGGEAQ